MHYVKLFNDGNWREGSSGATFTVENPAIEEVITWPIRKIRYRDSSRRQALIG
jgi:hypothetical protein